MRTAIRDHTGDLVRAMGGSGLSRVPPHEDAAGDDDLDAAMSDAGL
jgi:hypothetical protein